MSNKLTVVNTTDPLSFPTFHSEELTQAFTKFHRHIEGGEALANAVSDDIRALEAYLKKHALRVPFIIDGASSWSSEPPLAQPDADGAVGGRLRTKGLHWDEDSEGNYRLLYVQKRTYGRFLGVPDDLFCLEQFSSEIVERRPLIEAKLQHRLEMYPALPHFVKELATRTATEVPGAFDRFLLDFHGDDDFGELLGLDYAEADGAFDGAEFIGSDGRPVEGKSAVAKLCRMLASRFTS